MKKAGRDSTGVPVNANPNGEMVNSVRLNDYDIKLWRDRVPQKKVDRVYNKVTSKSRRGK